APGTVTPWGSWTLRPGVPVPEAPECPGWVMQRLNGGRNGSGPSGSGRWQRLDRGKLEPADLAAPEALEALGGHSAYIGPDGSVQVVRPGKTAGGSASIGHIGPGLVKVFTDAWPPLRQNAVYSADELLAISRGEQPTERDR